MQKILIALIIGLVVGYLASFGFNETHATLLGIVAFLVALWTNEGLPMGVVSLLPLMLFPIFEIVDFKSATSNYSKPIIFLFIGGFLLAMAVEKIGLHKVIANKLLSIFPSTPRGIIYSLAITSAVMSAFLSNTTITLMLAPIAMFLSENFKLKVRFLLAVAYGASVGGIITPIGTPPNLIYLGFMSEHGGTPITFVNWMFLTAPLAGLMLLIVPYILSIGVTKEKVGECEEILHLTPAQKRVGYVLLGLVVLLLANSPIKPYYDGLGLNEKMILLGFGLVMFLPKVGVLEWDDFKRFPYEIVFLFGAGFTIAMAFMKSGLAVEITNYLNYFGDIELFILLFLIAIFVSFSTEITSNTALTSIAMPIFFEFARVNGLHQEVVMLTATIAASYAFMLPIATPPNAIIMSFRMIKIKEMAKIGFFINMIGAFLLAIVAYFFWGKVL